MPPPDAKTGDTLAAIRDQVIAMEARCEAILALLGRAGDPTDWHMGSLEDVQPGDRVMVDQRWQTVTGVVDHFTDGQVTVILEGGGSLCGHGRSNGIRIAKAA